MAMHEAVEQSLREKPRRWLVTGAAGFIGSHLVERLLELEQTVRGLDNFATGKRENLAQVKKAVGAARWKRFRLIEGDIRSRATCREACEGAELVLHQAALGSVPASLDDPLAAHDANVTGFINMLHAAREAGAKRLVYAGSSAVYGDHPGAPSVEEHIGAPLSPYAVTKHVNEQYAAVFARCYGFASVGLRYFNVFGPRQDPRGAYLAVIPAWIGAMVRGEPVYINGDGKTTRDFCYVGNVVRANLLAATTSRRHSLNQVYNVAAGEATSLNLLFELIRARLAPHFQRLAALKPVYREFRPGDIAFSVGSYDKAARLLGYEPRWRVDEGLARTVDWYLGQLAPASRRAHSVSPLRAAPAF
jgi:UDP-N-acetylglucosamine 4-epimerase